MAEVRTHFEFERSASRGRRLDGKMAMPLPTSTADPFNASRSRMPRLPLHKKALDVSLNAFYFELGYMYARTTMLTHCPCDPRCSSS